MPVSGLPGPAPIEQILAGHGITLSASALDRLGIYLSLLIRWNARTNLTAVRDPEAVVERHFAESLLAGRLVQQLQPEARAVLDLGSGAGFPGLPMHIDRPELEMTLAESQGKKAAFLREAVRVLHLPTQVHGGRSETLAADRAFDAVMLRAVDDPRRALAEAKRLVSSCGSVYVLGGRGVGIPASQTLPLGGTGSILHVLQATAFSF